VAGGETKDECPYKRRLQFAAQYLPATREGRAPPYFASIPLDAPAPFSPV
jgi:hypothetical protein